SPGGKGKTGNGSTTTSGHPNTIKIVSSLPRTGSAKQQTDTIVNGIKMAIDEVGAKVGEFSIEYLDLDDATASAGQWTAEAETANADQAVKDNDVMVYIGTYNSGAAKISMPILNRSQLLMVSPANTWPGLTKPGSGDPSEPYVYRPTGKITYVRVVPADDLQGSLAAEWANDMKLKKVYILDDNEVYGRGIANLFEERAGEIGLTVLGHESIDAKSQEFKSLMISIKAKNPDLLYFGGTTQSKGGQIAKDMVAAGLTAKLMVPDGCMEEAFITSAGAENLNDRCFVTFGGLPPEKLTGAGQVFVEKYEAKYKSKPEAYAIYGYEAAKVALEAIKRAGKKDRAAITQAALGIKDFDGALGKWSVDANGDTTMKVLSGNTVKDGKFEFVRLLGQPESK
ncbi:MAG: branched-chain amino acid ABC transporter substrate-binding protein, partial [Candidatus Saccharimonas sp.]|nr:branched-chain amino acid ABC transporter substrate-binding protein [Planctomycetaceae bacterium]